MSNQMEDLCEDEGCEHAGTDHVCMSGSRLPDYGQVVQTLLRCMDHPVKNETSLEMAERMAYWLFRKYPALNTANDYRNVIDEALVTRYLGIANGNPKEELNRILDFDVSVALDPRVSLKAQELIDQGRKGTP